MREVKEKSPLKERTVKTLKSAPQAAFRRGTDASFQQLRQELRDAAQDGQSEDRYESGKITDTADHAVRQVSRLAEKAVHKLPKTKSEPQREARTESVPQHEQPRHPLQPTAVPREYPPQSQSQGNQSVRESASPIREKPVSPASDKQPKMREHTPTADASVQQSRHPASQIHEKSQVVSCSQVNQPVRELWSSVKEKSAVKAKPAEQRSLGNAPASTEPSAPATAPTVQPSARTLPREKPIVFSPREPLATPKTDTTQFALPEIKTKEYIRSRRQKQNFLKEEANGSENITADSETFSPVIRTRETVREQQKLHVSHSAEQEQPVMPQIRMRQPQTASMRANTESVTPDTPQTLLPDIKSKQKYIAAQQPTQVTPVQANPQQAAQKMIQGNIKLCQPSLTNETVPVPASRNVAPTKPARVQKQARPAFVKKQKIKTAPKAKIKSTTPAAKALPSKASAAAPKQAATVIRKGQVLRDTAIKTAKVAKEAGKKVLRAIAAAAEKLAEIAGVKCEELASEMFAAGSNLKNKSPEEIFYQDFKKFELNKSSFGVGQITSVNADELTEIKKELLPYMEKALGSHGESMLFFMLTDIINESTELLFYGGDSKNVVSEAFHKEPQEGEQSVILPGVVSRKKQLIPSFMTAMQQ